MIKITLCLQSGETYFQPLTNGTAKDVCFYTKMKYVLKRYQLIPVATNKTFNLVGILEGKEKKKHCPECQKLKKNLFNRKTHFDNAFQKEQTSEEELEKKYCLYFSSRRKHTDVLGDWGMI